MVDISSRLGLRSSIRFELDLAERCENESSKLTINFELKWIFDYFRSFKPQIVEDLENEPREHCFAQRYGDDLGGKHG